MWDSLKPNWNGNQMMWIESKIIALDVSWIESRKKRVSDPVKKRELDQVRKTESDPVENLGSNWVGKLWVKFCQKPRVELSQNRWIVQNYQCQLRGLRQKIRCGNGQALNTAMFLWRLRQRQRFWDCIRRLRYRRRLGRAPCGYDSI